MYQVREKGVRWRTQGRHLAEKGHCSPFQQQNLIHFLLTHSFGFISQKSCRSEHFSLIPLLLFYTIWSHAKPSAKVSQVQRFILLPAIYCRNMKRVLVETFNNEGSTKFYFFKKVWHGLKSSRHSTWRKAYFLGFHGATHIFCPLPCTWPFPNPLLPPELPPL